jgi:hypothetical protein
MSPHETRTIFLTINASVNVRDVLRTGVLATLKSSGHRIVILTPDHANPAFRDEFAAENVSIEPLHVHRPGRIERKLNSMRFTLFPDLSETVNMISQPRQPRSFLKSLQVRFALSVVGLMGQRATKRILMWLITYLFPDKYHAELFRHYKPDLICLTEVFHMAPDLWILKRAVREKIPTIAVVHSWDNLTTKGVFPAKPDKLVVWSDTMRREAVELHGYKQEDVFVAGAAQYDVFRDVETLPSRQEFFKRIGADPAKGLITYAMVPRTRFPNEFRVIEDLWDRLRKGAFVRPCQLLVRLYPLRGSEIPPTLRNRPDLLLDLPGRPSIFPDRDVSLADLRHLATTMRYSDVVLNFASTISIDAAVCDTPVVCVCFDYGDPKSYLQSVHRWYDETHYQKLLSTGGVRMAYSLEEAVSHVNAYLENPALDRDNRRRLVETLCYGADGQAGRRIGDYILQRLGEVVDARSPRPR